MLRHAVATHLGCSPVGAVQNLYLNIIKTKTRLKIPPWRWLLVQVVMRSPESTGVAIAFPEAIQPVAAQAANRLPRPGMHAVARRVSPEINSGFVGLSDGACATLDALLELQDALLDRIPACSAGGEGGGNAGGPGKRKRGSAAADAAEDEALPGCHG